MKNVIWIGLVLVLTACSSSNQLTEKQVNSNRVIGKTDKSAVFEEPPYAIKKVPLIYPQIAKSKRIEGEVWLEVELLADGAVGAVEVVKSIMPGPNGLDQAAVDCVKQWAFSPAKTDGVPVACWITFPMRFSLK